MIPCYEITLQLFATTYLNSSWLILKKTYICISLKIKLSLLLDNWQQWSNDSFYFAKCFKLQIKINKFNFVKILLEK